MAQDRGGSSMLLLVLLGLMAGGGIWNYQRNLEVESAAPRPYRGYSLADLETLQAAYQVETDKHQSRYRSAANRTVKVHEGGLIDQQVAEFERVQRIGQNRRAIASDYAKHQVQLDEILAELAARATEGNGWQLHLTRLTKYP
jgi:hypothetical protein